MIYYLLPQRLKERVKHNKPIVWTINIAALFIVDFIAHTILHHQIEKTTLIEAIWQTWQTVLTVGYGNAPATSLWGRVNTMILCSLGIALGGALISGVFEVIQYRKTRRRTGLMKNPHSEGCIVINFPGTGPFLGFINELRALPEWEDVPICVIDEKLEELPAAVAGLSDVHFVHGSPLDERIYSQANLKKASSIVVFPVQPGIASSDGATAITVKHVLGYCNNSSDVRVMYVLVDPNNADLFLGLNASSIFESFEVLAVVQEMQDLGSAGVYQTLLMNTAGPDPMTVVPYISLGVRWGDLRAYAAEAAQFGVKVMPVALLRDNQPPEFFPAYDEVLREGDAISLIAPGDFVWRQFESGLRQFAEQRTTPD